VSPILVLGLGNPLLGDDGVGWRVAEECEKNFETRVEIDCHTGGGLSLMERLVGYDRAILIDVLTTGTEPIGTVHSFPLEELRNPATGHLMSSHDTTLQNALDSARAMGVELPRVIRVVTVESPRVYDFEDELSPSVAAAVPHAAQIVEEILSAWDAKMDVP
jgi:hydrogenase maturation protease